VCVCVCVCVCVYVCVLVCTLQFNSIQHGGIVPAYPYYNTPNISGTYVIYDIVAN
jgi:hypothetical protein